MECSSFLPSVDLLEERNLRVFEDKESSVLLLKFRLLSTILLWHRTRSSSHEFSSDLLSVLDGFILC